MTWIGVVVDTVCKAWGNFNFMKEKRGLEGFLNYCNGFTYW